MGDCHSILDTGVKKQRVLPHKVTLQFCLASFVLFKLLLISCQNSVYDSFYLSRI